MYNQRNNLPPYLQEQQQEYQEQFSNQSEPLIEEVDNNYDPTDKQVREYAIDTLGMKLPEDQNLLYLAKEGLKAPLPTNWIPYQSRQGEIYYKHKITQQKIYDHPTDIEYKKLYSQQKQKMLRKNLKSMALKSNILQQQQLGINTGSVLSQGNNIFMPNLSNLTNKSNQQHIQSLDLQKIKQWQQQVYEFQKKQQRQWRELQEQLQEAHSKKMKTFHKKHLEQLEEITAPHKSGAKNNQIETHKNRIAENLQQDHETQLQSQLSLYRQQQFTNNLQQYQQVYEQDNKIKINKLEQQLQGQFKIKENSITSRIKDNQQIQLKYQQQKNEMIAAKKKQLLAEDNKEINQLLGAAIKDRIQNIRNQHQDKLNNRKKQLEANLAEYRKILGMDSNTIMQEYLTKKSKLQQLSTNKIESYKEKQILELSNIISQQHQKNVKQLQQRHSKQSQKQREKERNKLMNVEMKIKKQQIDHGYEKMHEQKIKQLHQNLQIEKQKYQKQSNNKLITLRNSYIDQMSSPSQNNATNRLSNQYTNRMLLKQKQQQISHKSELINSIQKQIVLESRQLRGLQFQKQLSNCIEKSDKQAHNKSQQNDSDDNGEIISRFLRDNFKKYNVQYRSPTFLKYLEQYRKYQNKYQQDKKKLNKICRLLQQTVLSSYTNNNNNGGGSSVLVHKYNEDIRVMRQNQKQLNKYQLILKKAEIGQQKEIKLLEEFINNSQSNIYQPIKIIHQIEAMNIIQSNNNYVRKQHGNNNNDDELVGLNQNELLVNENYKPNTKSNMNMINISSDYASSQNIESALRKHSQFLASVKNQLNRKLYQVRYDTTYNKYV